MRKMFIGHRNGAPLTSEHPSLEEALAAMREILSDPNAALKAGDRLAVLDTQGARVWKAVA